MKSNFFKYLFILFAIGIMIFAIFKIRSQEEKKLQEQTQAESGNKIKDTELKLRSSFF